MHHLKTKLQRFNNCSYNLYYGLLGTYQFDDFSLSVDQVQADPFAPPSKITITIPWGKTPFGLDLISTKIRTTAFCDTLARILAQKIRLLTKDDKGSGNGGFCGIRYGGQKVLESNAVIVKEGNIEIKLLAGLPGHGRKIAGAEAQDFLLKELTNVVNQSIVRNKDDQEHLLEVVKNAEKQSWLREECQKKGIVAFIANGAILARASSVSDKPMSHTKAKSFQSPPELQETLTLPDGSKIAGMAIPQGITLITGGGFHGKSTLLSTIAHAIDNHILGDGREYCVTETNAVWLRAEEGRYVEGVDISPFIHNLPENQSSTFFQTENASGSSSQATNLIEALEMGAKLFLIDEDVSATNFLIRDFRMRELVPDKQETITPLIAHMEHIKAQGASLIMVTGALGDFMNIADRVIVAHHYVYSDQTDKAQVIIKNYPLDKIPSQPFTVRENRIVLSDSVQCMGKKGRSIIDGEKGKIFFGRETIDMTAWVHLSDYSQYGTIAAVLAYAQEKNYFDVSPQEVWKRVQKDLEEYGWDLFSTVGYDSLSPREEQRKSKQHIDKLTKTKAWRYTVQTRPLDWHAALCRLRSLQCQKK